MITVAIILAGLIAAGATIALLALSQAPDGFEDEKGFHAEVSAPQVGERQGRGHHEPGGGPFAGTAAARVAGGG